MGWRRDQRSLRGPVRVAGDRLSRQSKNGVQKEVVVLAN